MTLDFAHFRDGRGREIMNSPQRELCAIMKNLERFAGRRELEDYYPAQSDIWNAIDTLAAVMDELTHKVDPDTDRRPKRSVAWQAYEPVEQWILRTGSGTGSARDLAVTYLTHLLGLPIDLSKHCWALDVTRSALRDAMLAASVPVDFPSAPFFRILWRYERTLKEALRVDAL
jgi:hypothetical protein